MRSDQKHLGNIVKSESRNGCSGNAFILSFASLIRRKEKGKRSSKSLQEGSDLADIHADIPFWFMQKSGDLRTEKSESSEDEQGICHVWLAGRETVLTDGTHPNDTDPCHPGGAVSVF